MTLTHSHSSAQPDPKNVRYDRQLRLWGDLGQKKLYNSRICLLNATTLGAEILKSLVLPGVGAFTVVDHRQVSMADIQSNFFVDEKFLKSPRAEASRQLLLELNPEVQGRSVCLEVAEMVANGNDRARAFLLEHDLVIGTDLSESTARNVASYLRQHGVTFLLCKTYGLMGYIRLITPEHHVVEAHPDFASPCFQLDRPFPEFRRLVDSIHLNKLTHECHSHTPYVILLLKALDQWQEDFADLNKSTTVSVVTPAIKNRPIPTTYTERMQLKKILLAMRIPDDKGDLNEENFNEAVNGLSGALISSKIPDHLNKLFDDPRTDLATTSDDKKARFWLMLRALRHFVRVDNDNTLPLRGDLPDMTADSAFYVAVQDAFRAEAERQAHLVHQQILQSNIVDISFDETRLFCKNAAWLRVVESRPLDVEFDAKQSLLRQRCAETLASRDEEQKRLLDFYLVLRACERFNDEKGRYPGTNGIPEQLDAKDLANRLKTLASDHHLPEEYAVEGKLVAEMCRYGASEIHTVASLVGGMAAHEAIKLLTGQYVPIDNTLIFDANSQAGAVFEF